MKHLNFKKPGLGEKFAEAIGNIVKELVIIFIGIFVLVGKLLFKFRKFEYRLGIFVTIFYFLATSFQNYATAPKIVYGFHIKTSPTPTPTQRQIIISSQHGDILLRIWENESAQGTAKGGKDNLQMYCENKGLTNEFGYGGMQMYCFKDFQSSVNRVNDWFTNCLSKNSLAECLNIYSGNSDTYISKFINQ